MALLQLYRSMSFRIPSRIAPKHAEFVAPMLSAKAQAPSAQADWVGPSRSLREGKRRIQAGSEYLRIPAELFDGRGVRRRHRSAMIRISQSNGAQSGQEEMLTPGKTHIAELKMRRLLMGLNGLQSSAWCAQRRPLKT